MTTRASADRRSNGCTSAATARQSIVRIALAAAMCTAAVVSAPRDAGASIVTAPPQRASSALAAGVPESPAGRNAVVAWNEIAAEAALATGITPLFDPLHESRLYAMTQLAVHDALNSIKRRSEPYGFDGRLWPHASPEAAVAASARAVLISVLGELPDAFPSAQAVELVETRYAAALATIAEGKAKQQGLKIGHDAAAAIIAMRAHDGADTTFFDTGYPQPEPPTPGQFRFVEGAPFAVAPHWGQVTPFVLHEPSQFRPRPPYALTSNKYAADFNELKRLGAIDSRSRTRDQTEIAFFWFEGSPLRWNRIARTVAERAGLNMWESARLLGLLNIALADGYVANWDTKYFDNFWRPETAVRQARTDGNPRTARDADWTPLWGSSGATPEYESGHAIEGAAAAQVMKQFFGTDRMSFTVCSYTLPTNTCADPAPRLRSYTRFSQASDENAISRILIGWHFRNSVEQGQRRGMKIAKLAVREALQPVARRACD
jgi:hypothetical protein